MATLAALIFVLAVLAWPPFESQRRLGRWQFAGHPDAPLHLVPRVLETSDAAGTPWVIRIFWLRACLGLMKSDWDHPTRLSRQLRRQLQRKGSLTLLAAR